jgi:hypothetical protein
VVKRRQLLMRRMWRMARSVVRRLVVKTTGSAPDERKGLSGLRVAV